MFIRRLFKKKSIKNLGRHNCYLTIDELPVKIWFDIHKEANYSKLVKVEIPFTDKIVLQLSKIWDDIYNQFIERFGLSDEFMTDLRDEIKLANLQADYIITGDRYLVTLIKIEKEKKRIADLDVKPPTDLDVILARMSKYYGFKLSSRELTVSEYYSYINNILEDGKTN